MKNGDKSIYVTRAEFYGAMIIIWTYLMIVFSNLLEPITRRASWLLWGASFVMMVGYIVLAVRAKRAQRRSGKSL
jgi:cytochrome c-type biogenesis protein CcmH/NrfF